MRVLALRGHGGMEQYKSEEWPEPVPGEGDALIEVKACGLNYLDIFVRRGMPNLPVSMPRIPGSDIAGIVRSVGAGVSETLIGTRVLLHPRPKSGGVLGEDSNGGLCELIAFEADKLLPLSDSTSFEQAAALPVAYGSAYRMMYTRADVQPGELVLILGASGGVGTACTQLAKNRGCAVIACASSADKLEKLAALGADHGINYVAEDFSAAAWRISGKRGVDVVVNYTGGDTWVPSLRVTRRGGRIVCCGATASYDPATDLRYLWRRELTILGSTGWTRNELEALLSEVEAGRITPVIHGVYSFDDACEALRAIEEREVFGKVIVTP